MTRISRDLSFFRENYMIIMAILWLVIGITSFFLQDDAKEGFFKDHFVAIGYTIVGILYGFSAFKNRSKNAEYIEWDDQNLIIQKAGAKALNYRLTETNEITVTPNNLIVKAPNAAGTMAELKGYSEEDIALLKSRFRKVAATS